jgi:hypothetical protein
MFCPCVRVVFSVYIVRFCVYMVHECVCLDFSSTMGPFVVNFVLFVGLIVVTKMGAIVGFAVFFFMLFLYFFGVKFCLL